MKNKYDQQQEDYQRIETAISYIRTHFREQPSLDTLAAQVHLSPFHFQRLFTEWAGVSPKKFLQYTSLDYAKSLLRETGHTVADAAFEAGLSGTGRLHDLFVHIEAMTPGAYRNGAELDISYELVASPFGPLLAAATEIGICALFFTNSETEGLGQLQRQFPKARLRQEQHPLFGELADLFSKDTAPATIRLHLKGSPFQLKVWEALLRIPEGRLSSYGQLAAAIGSPAAARAVGSAIGSNPVAYLIPCHRVIRADGQNGGYMWGTDRKTAMIGWEAARNAGKE